MKKADLFFAFILLPVDVLMIIISFGLAFYVRADLEVGPAFSAQESLTDYLHYSIYLLPAWLVLLALNGLYQIRVRRGRFDEVYRIFNASSAAMLFLVVWIFLSRSFFFSRLILVFTWAFSVILIALGRFMVSFIQRYLLRYGVGQKKVLLIGDNSTSETVANYLSSNINLGYKVKGVLNGESKNSRFGLKVIGSIDQLKDKIGEYKIDEVILTDINLSKSKMLDIIQTCSDLKVVFKHIPDTYSLMTLNVSTGLLGSMPVTELKPIPLDGWGRITKRIFDMLLALVSVVILSPLFIVVSLLVKFTSRGPIFYSHQRVGRDEKNFRCFKFRSMYVDACDFTKGGTKWTTEKDTYTRVTPLGRFMRKSYLDELPQLWNILKGEMSFVGPRPEQPKLVKKFENEIPEYFKRHRVKAGLTGWAQVSGLKGDTSIKERVRYDIYYIENWSLWFDFKIVIKTFLLVIYEIFSGKYEYRSRS